jgi:hypothetical protein
VLGVSPYAAFKTSHKDDECLRQLKNLQGDVFWSRPPHRMILLYVNVSEPSNTAISRVAVDSLFVKFSWIRRKSASVQVLKNEVR